MEFLQVGELLEFAGKIFKEGDVILIRWCPGMLAVVDQEEAEEKEGEQEAEEEAEKKMRRQRMLPGHLVGNEITSWW